MSMYIKIFALCLFMFAMSFNNIRAAENNTPMALNTIQLNGIKSPLRAEINKTNVLQETHSEWFIQLCVYSLIISTYSLYYLLRASE